MLVTFFRRNRAARNATCAIRSISGVGQRLARGVDAGPADGRLGDLEREAELFFRRAQDFDRLAHDFGSDAVAGERCYFECFHELRALMLRFWRAVTTANFE